MAWRSERASRSTLAGEQGMSAGIWVPREALAKNVCDWGETVVGLVSGNVVNVGGIGQLGGLMCDMSGKRMRRIHACKSLTQRR